MSIIKRVWTSIYRNKRIVYLAIIGIAILSSISIALPLDKKRANELQNVASTKQTSQNSDTSNTLIKPASGSSNSIHSTSTATTTPKVLFNDPLNGPDRIVTNEYVHWSNQGKCPYASSVWDMTSGTLMIKDGSGYSGIPTAESNVPCDSAVKNNSAVFRLNTKESDFSNVAVSLDYKPVEQGNGGVADHSYDGIHIWVGYQSQYALYAATIFRWDTNLVIKKKIPIEQSQCSDPSNQGCYYYLSDETKHPDLTKSGVWHHAEIDFTTTGDNSKIKESIDGIEVFDITDNKINGPAYKSGAVGVRGDNTEFYFKNFTVVQL